MSSHSPKDLQVIQELKRRVEASPKAFDARLNLAIALFKDGHVQEALLQSQQAVLLRPDEGMAHELSGKCLQELGRFDEAISSFSSAMTLRPKRLANYTGFINSKQITPADVRIVERLAAMLQDPSMPPVGSRTINFGLGKAYNDLGDYAKAMEHYDEAHRIAKRHPEIHKRTTNLQESVDSVNLMMSVFTKDFVEQYQHIGSASGLPVLIVGMPRSGTTLTEQIISSHPEVGAAGELYFWRERVVEIFGGPPSASINLERACNLIRDYLRLLVSIAPTATRVVDKYPVNYLVLGPIHLLFPNALIIHCRRHPVDTCLSMYMTLSENDHDKKDLVTIFRLYERLMMHWAEVLPARILEVRYEDLVTARETATRKMIHFLDLPWDKDCLSYEKNSRKVDTPSKWQVRQPIYKTSVERWRRYRPWLDELTQLLTLEESEDG